MRIFLILSIITATGAFVVPQAQSLGLISPQTIGNTVAPSKSKSRLYAAVVKEDGQVDEQVESSTEAQSDSQNIFGLASDAITGFIFSLLHAFDDCGIADSSKNLRVLWVRALLNYKGKIKDDVAATFLPPTTRSLVTSDAGAQLLEPILKFAEWIQARTEFIDASLGNFLSSPVCKDPETGEAFECNVVLFGAGYDTRALRYRHEHEGKINFIEVDLPSVVEGKGKLYEKFQREQDPAWDLQERGSKLIPFNLNDCGGKNPTSLIDTLRTQGKLKENAPTFLVWEAVLFYVNEDAVRNIMAELFAFARKGGNGDKPRAETMLCFTDSLKPFVDVPFTNEARKFFNRQDLDLVQHRARWGGAVHFALATTKGARKDETISTAKKSTSLKPTGKIGMHMKSEVGNLVNSYTPTQANNPAILRDPSFDNTWYAVAYPWQIDGFETPLDASLNRKDDEVVKPFATRLWGEPLVIYRDTKGELVALADVCPHRSAPLSMGKVENGELSCMYHGWKFGAKGACTDIPTLRTVDDDDKIVEKDHSRVLSKVTKANCGNNRAVVQHEGLVYIWRGNVLEADPSLLPTRRKGDMETVPIDTVLDYNVDYSYVVENNLDSPHLFYLHDGSVPPIESIGMLNKNLPKLKLTSFTDDCGMGHLGRFGTNGRPKKLLRFDPPNIVRHGGVSGFEEEFHIVPIAPQRTRVLLRQHLPRGPILSTITGIPGLKPVLTLLVNNWNYHIGLEDACLMQGQASRIEDWGSPRLAVGGLGDDLIKRYWKWRSEAHEELKSKGQSSPYMVEFAGGQVPASIPSGTSFGDDPALIAQIRKDSRLRNIPLVSDNQEVDEKTGSEVGTWGILSDYVQNTPAANFPPVNYKQYKNMLVLDDVVKSVFQKDADAPIEAPCELYVAPIE